MAWKSLVFPTEPEAYAFYDSYAKNSGFSIKKAYVWRNSKNEKIDYPNYLTMQCHKQGFKAVRRVVVGHVVKKRKETRTGCKATMKLKMDVARGGYIIYNWFDEHTHELIDFDKRHLLPSNRTITAAQKLIIDNNLASGIASRSIFHSIALSTGGTRNVGFIRKDLHNYIAKTKQKAIEPGEASVLQSWFRNQALSNPGFYYDIQVDDNEAIASIFWADSVMRADYAHFGDFVSFDTTYRTNKEFRPLGIFVGFNHHKGTCVFGGTLLYDETAITFKWLFRTFLKCMNEKKPVTFMTDQAHAIGAAVRDVFPNVFHALCSWHIKENATKKLGSNATAMFFDEFKHLIKHVDNEDEFEYSWKHMLISCFKNRQTSEVPWLDFIYTSRKQWSSAWVKNSFTAGKRTTQLSEQFNAFARFYLKPEHSITQLLAHFQDLVDDLRHNELISDFYMQHTVTQNRHPSSHLMNHAAEIFTPAIFELIQKEYDTCASYMNTAVNKLKRGTTDVILVQRWDNKNKPNEVLVESEKVEIDLVKCVVTCSCRFFENWWFVCRHILRVLDAYGMWDNPFCLRIPDMYIKKRWCREMKKDSVSSSLDNIEGKTNYANNYGTRYQRLCSVMIEVASRICFNEVSYNFFMSKVVAAAKEAEQLFHCNDKSSEPSRSECASTTRDPEEFPATKLKERRNPCKSKIRLMSESEKRHLIWKQQRKKEIELLKFVELDPSGLLD